MNIWLLSDGEPLPGHSDGRRMRSWMLADTLASRGHRVVWWASTFSHHGRRVLYDKDVDIDVSDRLRLRLLYCGGYAQNAALARYRHHRLLGTRFKQVAAGLDAPDVIVSACPKIDMAFEGLRFARRHGVRIAIDVRDLWPVTYLDKVPYWLRPAARVAFDRDFRRARAVFRDADSLVAMSSGVLDWARQFSGRPAGPLDRVFYIGYPNEVETDGLPAPPYLANVPGKTVFTYVGAFGGLYDLRTICDVAKMLHDEGREDIVFVLGGDGPLRPDVERRVAGLTNVIVPGWLDHPAVKQLLAHSDVAIIPWNSLPGAMPNKVFEYLAAGLPVLSSLKGEMEAIISSWRVGRSYAPGDANALFGHVVELAGAQATRTAMRAQAKALFRSRFESAEIYSAYAAHVESLGPGVRHNQPVLAATGTP